VRYGPYVDDKAARFGYSDVFGYDLLESYGDSARLLAICNPRVFRLLVREKGKKRSTEDLIKTLKCYIECMGDADRVAKKLYVHKNTIYYRMNQLAEITGLDLSNGRTLLHLLFSIYILELDGKFKK